jgi:hypothetical protein
MPRPRTPTAILELRGAFKNHPSRKKDRAGEVRSNTPLPGAPQLLTKRQKEIWADLKKRGIWLTSPDRFLVEIAAVLLDKHERKEIDYKEVPHLISVLSKLCFTPVERQKMNAGVQDRPLCRKFIF